MKKIIVASFLLSSIFLAACSADEENNVVSDTAPEQATEVNTKVELVKFHMEIINNFNDEYQTYIAYGNAVSAREGALAAQSDIEVASEDKPTSEELAELEEAIQLAKVAAQGIADSSAEEIRNFAIPTELEQSSESIKSALDDLAKFYEGIEADIENSVTNEEFFQSFNDKMGKLFEQADLPAPNYFNALS